MKVHAPSRNIKSTARRGFAAPDHWSPNGKHSGGRGQFGSVWQGASRIVDRPGRRRANRRTWETELTMARRRRIAISRIDEELAS